MRSFRVRRSFVRLTSEGGWFTPAIDVPHRYQATPRELEDEAARVIGRNGFATVGGWASEETDSRMRACITLTPTENYHALVKERCAQVPRLLGSVEGWTIKPREHGGWTVEDSPNGGELILLWTPGLAGDVWSVVWRYAERRSLVVATSGTPAAALEAAPVVMHAVVEDLASEQ
ncbi:hypothetical protein O1L44_00015 [Streptomyces noursei]|uniref:hypothetical protein n=1 Tax=Streptomyces noursei TaxID=1971 RepID=UPI00081D13E4|nr:hypothetical protein SNOUR_00015 [Streptomyces noursei ATCC 11455]ANZ22009.1 hypothetical protein SNOUR_43935 [Streptomyces noursei ATCC 11455]MCZ0991847.1 hypothetical protein [Streptomyces noursei]